MQHAVNVDQAALQHLGHPGPLLGQEAAVLAVAAPVLQVLLLVGDVHVAAQHEVALAREPPQVRLEFVQEAELGLLPQLAGRAAGKITTDDGQFARGRVESQFQVAAFGVEFRRAVADDHVARQVPGVHGHPGIALLLRKVKIALQPRHLLEPTLHVAGLRLDLLQADAIGPGPGDPGFHALARGRTDAVQVEAGEFEQGVSHGGR